MLLDHLADVLTFAQIDTDRYVAASFADKKATRAELRSDDRLYDRSELSELEDVAFVQGCYLLALAVVVSGQTVDDRLAPLSTHSMFLRAGDATQPAQISVERDSDSRRFPRRRVQFSQQDRVFFSSDICFHRPDPDAGSQQVPPDMPAAAEMASSLMFIPLPVMEARPLAGPESSVLDDVVFPVWVRFPAGVPASPTWAAAALAWASDYFVAQSMLLGSGRSSTTSSARTIEHSMWFHCPIDPADWFLVNMEPASLTDQRYLATGTIHDQSGVLAATIVQAGIVLPDPTI